MNRALFLSAAAITTLLVTPGAFAQPGSSSGIPGTPSGNPYGRPVGMGENDTATMPSASDQLGVGTQAASDRRAAERARQENGAAVPAKPADIVAQALVNDKNGQPIGTIASVDTDGAVVATAAGKVMVPLNAFGKNKKGLLLDTSKRDFDALVAKANAAPAG